MRAVIDQDKTVRHAVRLLDEGRTIEWLRTNGWTNGILKEAQRQRAKRKPGSGCKPNRCKECGAKIITQDCVACYVRRFIDRGGV